MRYAELHIETQRQPPARPRSEGEAWLRRAGYLLADGDLTALGRRAVARIGELAETHPPAQLFELLGLPVAVSGAEYYYTISGGKVEFLRCPACGYAAPRPRALFLKPDPAAEPPAPKELVLTPDCHTIESLAAFLDIPESKTAKALMYTRTSDDRFVFVVVRGDMQASEAKLADLAGPLRAATTAEIEAAGATPGYASPLGLKGALVVVDDLIPRSPNLVAGANKPGYHLLNTNSGRDYQPELVGDIVLAEPGAPCPNCTQPLEALNASLLTGPDGYHLEAVLEAVAQEHHDDKGLKLPPAAAPFDVYLLHLPGKELDTQAKAAQLYADWQAAGFRVLLDDRDERAGVKFNDADLIGCPTRATVGERAMKDGMVELKDRASGESRTVPFGDVPKYFISLNKVS